MTRGTRVFMVAASGVAAMVARRGVRGRSARSRGAAASVTVAGPAGDVTRVWRDRGGTAPIDVADAPGDFGTEVRVRGEGEPQAREHLRHLKAVVEAGEVVTVEGQPSGRGPVAERLTRAVTGRLRAGGVA